LLIGRYELNGLVELCGETLSKSLSIDNVIERLNDADRFDSSSLKVGSLCLYLTQIWLTKSMTGIGNGILK
jgi:hypothetical protein